MVDLLLNEVDVFDYVNLFFFIGMLVLNLLDWIGSLDELGLYMEVDSFWGLLLLVVL